MARETTDDLKKAQKSSTGHGPGSIIAPAKAKNFSGSLKQLSKYLSGEKIKLFLVLIFAITGTVFAIAGPKISANATNKIQEYVIQNEIYSQISAKMPATENANLPSAKFKDLPKYLETQISEKFTVAEKNPDIESLPAEQKSVAMAKIEEQKSAALKEIKPLEEMVSKTLDQMSGDQKDLVANMDIFAKPEMDFKYIFWDVVLILIFLYILSTAFSYMQSFLAAGITQRLAFKLRKELSEKINTLPLSYFDSRQFGDVLSRITNDVDLVQQSLSQSLSNMISSLVMIIGIPIMMFTISWQMALISLTVIPISMIFVGITIKKSQKFFLTQQKTLGELNGHIEEIYSGHNIVKIFDGEEKAAEEFRKMNTELQGSAWKSQFFSGLMWPITNIIGNLGYVGVALMGGWLAINRGLGIGDILAFIQYVQQFNQPIMQLGQTINIIQPMAAAAERVFEFLEEEDESPDPIKPKQIAKVKGAIEFKNIQFAYEAGKPIINNFSTKVKPGQTVAIVGPTGAGKTTIVNLLMRFYDPQSGEITIDGVNTKEMSRADVRKNFAMVLQDTWLFSGTIRENLTYGKHDATEEEIKQIAEAAHLTHFIASLPQGYDTFLGEDAENVSSGEKQLLTIARAMLANPPMLILDEATSNVDTSTESHIQHAMWSLMKGRTSFVIAHRLSTIRDADLILVMNKGDIIESGNHSSLLRKKGFYANLYNSQFDEPAEEY